MIDSLQFELKYPDQSLSDFVYCFTSLQNFQDHEDAVIIPNGRVDLIFSKTDDGLLQIALLGLETKPKYVDSKVNNFFSVSFNPLAIEYLFSYSIAGLLDTGMLLPSDFWGIGINDLNDFDGFCKTITTIINSHLLKKIDERKRKLFQMIFGSNGEISITELSQIVIWNQRQINRYFNQQFGLSLKSYCKILRFQASLPHIKHGELYPQLNFSDQSHFIKEIKQFAGVSPKELYKNKNDRFLQFLFYKDK